MTPAPDAAPDGAPLAAAPARGASGDLPDARRVIAAIRATWGPAHLSRTGPFEVPSDTTGGRRNCAARLAPVGAAFTEADLAAVEALKPGAIFGTLDDLEDPLATALAARGYRAEGVTTLMAGPVAPLLADPPPPVSGFPHWPPSALAEDLWAAQGTGPDRLAVAARAPDPKAAILLRASDRAAGALFVALHGDMAALHMVFTLPARRRQGVGGIGLRHAARFADRHGARWIVLPVESDNAPARALYRRAGLTDVGGYRYWRRPPAAA